MVSIAEKTVETVADYVYRDVPKVNLTLRSGDCC